MSRLSQSSRILYNGYSVTATTDYVYNDSGSSAATSGWLDRTVDECVLQFGCATLTASTLSIRIEGRKNSSGRAAEIYSLDITAVDTIDRFINVIEAVDDLRVGVKVSDSTATNTIYSSILLAEVK